MGKRNKDKKNWMKGNKGESKVRRERKRGREKEKQQER